MGGERNLRSPALTPENTTPYDERIANKQNVSQINLCSFWQFPQLLPQASLGRRGVYDVACTSVSERKMSRVVSLPQLTFSSISLSSYTT